MQTDMKNISRPRPAVAGLRLKAVLLLLLSLWGWIFFPPRATAEPSLTVDKQYRQAKAYYANLQSAKKDFSRDNWLKGVRAFRKLYMANPEHPLAPSCLYMLGRIYRTMFERQGNILDLGESIAYYEDVATLFPQHRLADDALYALATIYLDKGDERQAVKLFTKITTAYPAGDMAQSAQAFLGKLNGQEVAVAQELPSRPAAPAPQAPAGDEGCSNCPAADMAVLQPVRYWSNNNYTRVVIETSAPVTFNKYVLEQEGDTPRRLYVDLDNCRIAPGTRYSIPIEDGLLKQVRQAQFSPDTVRVVLDTQSSIAEHKIFSLSDPFRVVIDVKGEGSGTDGSKQTSEDVLSIVQQLGLSIRRIVLDPGHGGKDPGTISPSGLKEKDIVLKVARLIAPQLREQLGCEVILTRDRDVYVPLEERTAIANSKEADLFVSIHVNSAPTPAAKGIETYVLDLATNTDAMRVAAQENATSTSQIGDLQSILLDLIQNTKINESAKLAELVQDSIVKGLNRTYPGVTDLGVKKAPFVVLIGAQMPAILTEIAFLSNPTEARRLQSDRYLAKVAEQITAGISSYASNLNLAANYNNQ